MTKCHKNSTCGIFFKRGFSELSVYCQCIICASSAYHQCIISASSAHHHAFGRRLSEPPDGAGRAALQNGVLSSCDLEDYYLQ